MNTFSSLSFEKYKSFFPPYISNEMKNIFFIHNVVIFTAKLLRNQYPLKRTLFSALQTWRAKKLDLKGTQDWEFFWLRFWNLRYFFVSYLKILRFYKKVFWVGPLLGEVRFFRVVLGLCGMKKNFELGQKIFFLLQLWTLNMTQY